MKYLLVLSFILALSACHGYDDTVAFKHLELPPYTETGANTFGCLVNGAIWANFGDNNFKSSGLLAGRHLTPNVVRAHTYWNISGMDSVFVVSAGLTVSKDGTDTRYEIMAITIPKNGNLKGVHQLTSYDYQLRYTNGITGVQNLSLVRNPFTVTIKKDTIEGSRHIVSGTFSGTLYSEQSVSGTLAGPFRTDSLRITAGVFDTTLN